MSQRKKLSLLELALSVGLPFGIGASSKLFARDYLVRSYLADVLIPLGIYNFLRMKDESKTFSFLFSTLPWFGVEIAQAFKAYPGGVYDSFDFLAYTLGGGAGVGIDKLRDYFKSKNLNEIDRN